MGSFLASLAMRGVALAGTVVVTCAVVRGLIRAARDLAAPPTTLSATGLKGKHC